MRYLDQIIHDARPRPMTSAGSAAGMAPANDLPWEEARLLPGRDPAENPAPASMEENEPSLPETEVGDQVEKASLPEYAVPQQGAESGVSPAPHVPSETGKHDEGKQQLARSADDPPGQQETPKPRITSATVQPKPRVVTAAQIAPNGRASRPVQTSASAAPVIQRQPASDVASGDPPSAARAAPVPALDKPFARSAPIDGPAPTVPVATRWANTEATETAPSARFDFAAVAPDPLSGAAQTAASAPVEVRIGHLEIEVMSPPTAPAAPAKPSAPAPASAARYHVRRL